MYHANRPGSALLAPARRVAAAGQLAPPTATCPVCPSLPSSSSALDFVQGKPGSVVRVTGHLLGRAALISIGIYLGGERDAWGLVKKSVLSAATIEAFVLAYVAATSGRAARAAQEPASRSGPEPAPAPPGAPRAAGS